jgi:hypothetical protein
MTHFDSGREWRNALANISRKLQKPPPTCRCRTPADGFLLGNSLLIVDPFFLAVHEEASTETGELTIVANTGAEAYRLVIVRIAASSAALQNALNL